MPTLLLSWWRMFFGFLETSAMFVVGEDAGSARRAILARATLRLDGLFRTGSENRRPTGPAPCSRGCQGLAMLPGEHVVPRLGKIDDLLHGRNGRRLEQIVEHALALRVKTRPLQNLVTPDSPLATGVPREAASWDDSAATGRPIGPKVRLSLWLAPVSHALMDVTAGRLPHGV